MTLENFFWKPIPRENFFWKVRRDVGTKWGVFRNRRRETWSPSFANRTAARGTVGHKKSAAVSPGPDKNLEYTFGYYVQPYAQSPAIVSKRAAAGPVETEFSSPRGVDQKYHAEEFVSLDRFGGKGRASDTSNARQMFQEFVVYEWILSRFLLSLARYYLGKGDVLQEDAQSACVTAKES